MEDLEDASRLDIIYDFGRKIRKSGYCLEQTRKILISGKKGMRESWISARIRRILSGGHSMKEHHSTPLEESRRKFWPKTTSSREAETAMMMNLQPRK